uniref:G protein-coupled receptor n=1 Tax=Pristionchus pacificus TaxID=54126 RepID=A0A2A6CY77_PRIPA|eukprot:PDM83088.1 G protein-coupled receptor [Pristionchus pacificus]
MSEAEKRISLYDISYVIMYFIMELPADFRAFDSFYLDMKGVLPQLIYAHIYWCQIAQIIGVTIMAISRMMLVCHPLLKITKMLKQLSIKQVIFVHLIIPTCYALLIRMFYAVSGWLEASSQPFVIPMRTWSNDIYILATSFVLFNALCIITAFFITNIVVRLSEEYKLPSGSETLNIVTLSMVACYTTTCVITHTPLHSSCRSPIPGVSSSAVPLCDPLYFVDVCLPAVRVIASSTQSININRLAPALTKKQNSLPSATNSMESRHLSAEELITIRKRIFSILEDSTGRVYTEDLHNTGHEQCKINHRNMTEGEKKKKTIIRTYFVSPSLNFFFFFASLIEIDNSINAILIYQGINDPVSIRKRVFSILDGRIFTKDEFIEFFLSIYKLHKIGCERFKINHGNMTEKEKKTIRILFSCNQHQFLTTINVDSTSWIEMAESSNAVLISEGISEYRRDVLPEFLRVFKEGEAIADEQNRHAFLLEESLLIFDEKLTIRDQLFSILDDSSGRIFTKDEFFEFLFSINKLHKTGHERFKINYGNMTGKEKKIIHKYFLSPSPDSDFMSWEEILNLPYVMVIYQGISEYRREVLPEFSRVFEYSIMKELSTDGINTDEFFLATCTKSSKKHFIVDFFTASNAHFHEVVLPEYELHGQLTLLLYAAKLFRWRLIPHPGMSFTAEQFIDFYLGIYSLREVEEHNIRFETMSDDEKIVQIFFYSGRDPSAALEEFKRDVLPEFSRLFDERRTKFIRQCSNIRIGLFKQLYLRFANTDPNLIVDEYILGRKEHHKQVSVVSTRILGAKRSPGSVQARERAEHDPPSCPPAPSVPPATPPLLAVELEHLRLLHELLINRCRFFMFMVLIVFIICRLVVLPLILWHADTANLSSDSRVVLQDIPDRPIRCSSETFPALKHVQH